MCVLHSASSCLNIFSYSLCAIGIEAALASSEFASFKLLSKEKQIKNLRVMTVGSTTKLNVKEFNEYLEQVKHFAKGYGFKLNEEEV